ncbi:MAG: tetratricopeptide repeat protein [Hyphomicrobiales bacterium]|nr:tetratricopeptide repeat protein [Hyphomicrobiales bacterium]
MARVFISHSSRDNAEAQALFAWLKSQGFDQGFLDIDKHSGIPAGARWEQTLYDELERAQAVILLLTKNWFESKWCFAEFAQARSRGKAVFPVVVSPAGDQFVGDDLQKLDLTKDRESGLERLALRLTEVALLSQGGFDFPAGRAPYPGFLAFDEADAAVYFGRDDDIRRLVQRLDSRRIEGGRRLVLVLGESGTGKSSLIRAGLIPRLKRARREWITLTPLRPETDPFEGLALSLTEAGYAITGAEVPDVDPRVIAAALAEACGAPRAGVLIAIDQAEELFTRTPTATAERFFAFLSKLLASGLPFVAVATLRSDHLGDMQTAEGLTAEFEDFTLRPLPVERIGEIVRGPARIVGLDVEPELVTRITADAKTTDALPLVAYALRRLYDAFGDDNRIQLVEYESLRDAAAGLSPLETIVRETAARVIAETKPSEAELMALREAFVPGLVRVNDEGGFVRHAARWDELPEASRRLAAALAGPEARLLVVREQEGVRQIEVAHEALFRVWPLLAGWLDEEEEFLIGRNRLERELADWKALPESDRAKGLMAGILLDRAKGWLIDHPARFTSDEAAFVRASEAAEMERRRKAEEQRRALEEAHLRQAETERDAARRLTGRTRIAAVVLGVVALAAAGAGLYAMQAEGEAVRQAEIAEGQRQVAESEAVRANAEAERANQQAEAADAARAQAEAARARAETEKARATREAERASRNFEIAKSTVDQVIFDIAQGLQNVEGMRLETLRTVLTRVEAAMGRLADAAPNDLAVQRSRFAMLHEFGNTYIAVGDAAGARAAYEEGLAIARRLADTDPANTLWQRDVAVGLNKIGDVKLRAGDAAGALAAYEEILAIGRRLADTDRDNIEWQRSVMVGLNKIGDVKLRVGDAAGALAAYDEGLAIARRLADTDPANTLWQGDVSISLNKIGDVKLRVGDAAGALAAYDEGLGIRRRLADTDPANTLWQRDVAVGLDGIGDVKLRAGDAVEALAAYEEGLAIRRRLSDTDPDNTLWQGDVLLSLARIGNTYAAAGDAVGARAAYEESLAIARRLADTDPENTQWQRDVSFSLDGIGDVKLRAGDAAEALAAYEESLVIHRRLAETDPDNTGWQRDVSLSLARIGNVKLRAGDAAGAMATYEESLAIARRLTNTDPDNTEWQGDVSFSLERIGDVKLDAGDAAGALAAYDEGLAIRRRLAEIDPGNIGWQRDVLVSLERIGDVKLRVGDAAGALAAYDEGLAIHRRLADTDPDNAQWQRDVSFSLERIGDVKLRAGDTAGALAAYEEGLAIRRRLTETDPANTEWQWDVSVSLDRIGNLKLDAGDAGGALAAYEEGLGIRRRLVDTDSNNAELRSDLAKGLGNAAFTYLHANRAAEAESSSREAIAIAPTETWLATNLAHALMLQGKLREADEIYLGHRGESVGQISWEDAVLADFTELRTAGIDHPHMAEIERIFSSERDVVAEPEIKTERSPVVAE